MKLTPYQKTFSFVGLSYFLLLALTTLCSVGCQLLMMELMKPADLSAAPWATFIFSSVPLYCFIMPFFLMIWWHTPATAKPQKKNTNAETLANYFYVCLAIALVSNMVSVALRFGIGAMMGKDLFANTISEQIITAGLGWNTLYLVIIAPLGEEFLFRKTLYEKLGAYGDKLYILFSALLFALFHQSFEQFFYAFCIGAALAYLYAHTGNYWMVAMLHALINLFGGVLPLLFMGSPLLSLVFTAMEFGICIWGVRLLWQHRKTFVFRPSDQPLPAHPVRKALLTFGMLSAVGIGSGVLIFTAFFI